MKHLILIFFIPMIMFARMDAQLVSIEGKLFSKMVFLDYEYKKKLLNGKVVIFILYDSLEYKKIAKEFVKELNGKKILGTNVRAEAVNIKQIGKEVPTAYIAVLKPENMKSLADKVISKKRLIFTSDKNLIDYAMVSIYLGSRIVPIINPKLIKSSGIELRPIIFKVAKVYDNEN